jgi:prophage regulatory protein
LEATTMSDAATKHHNDLRTKRRGPHTYARELPVHGYARLETVLTVFPVGRSTWWKGVKEGRYPPPVKLGPRVTAWRVSDIRALLEGTLPGNEAA